MNPAKFSTDGRTQENPKKEKVLTVEILFERLGGFSWFQLWALVVTISPEISAAMLSLSPVFTGSDQFCRNGTEESLSEGCQKPSSFPGVAKTVVIEWDLGGSNAWISDLFTSFQMFGALFGAVISGHFAERYGRKKAHFTLCFLMGLFGFVSGWAPDPYTFCVFRFLTGFTVGGCYVVFLNYLMEFLTPTWRTVCGCVSLWSAGEMLLALVGYLMPGWRQITWATSVPAFLILFAYRWMPESPRWLLCHGRTAEAVEVFDQIAKWNGRPSLDPSDIKALQKQISMDGGGHDYDDDDDDKSDVITNSNTIISSKISISTISSKEGSNVNLCYQEGVKRNPSSISSPSCFSSPRHWNCLEIFKYRQYRLQLALLMFAWFSSQLIYYGISFNMKMLCGNPYMKVFYMGIIGLPGSFAGLLFNNRLGRRKTIIGFALISFLFLVALIGLEEATTNPSEHFPNLIIFLCLSVRLFVAAGFAVLSCFTAESFPTVVRVSCMGICALVGNVGGILAPQLVYMSTVVNSAQYITFAFLSLAVIVGAYNLKEMTGKPLEDFLKKGV